MEPSTGAEVGERGRFVDPCAEVGQNTMNMGACQKIGRPACRPEAMFRIFLDTAYNPCMRQVQMFHIIRFIMEGQRFRGLSLICQVDASVGVWALAHRVVVFIVDFWGMTTGAQFSGCKPTTVLRVFWSCAALASMFILYSCTRLSQHHPTGHQHVDFLSTSPQQKCWSVVI